MIETDQFKLMDKEQLIIYIKSIQKNDAEKFNEILTERDRLKKQIKDLTLQNLSLLVFKTSISKSLDKIVKELKR